MQRIVQPLIARRADQEECFMDQFTVRQHQLINRKQCAITL